MARGRKPSGGGRGTSTSTVTRIDGSTSMKAGKRAASDNRSSLLAKVAAAGQGRGAGLIGKGGGTGGEGGSGRGRGGSTRGRGGTSGRRGRGRRPSGNKTKGKNNSQGPQTSLTSAVIVPVVPPLYPQLAVKTSPLDAHLNSLVPTLLELTKYFKCNYSIPLPKAKYPSPFEVKRYSDRYNGPLSLDPLLVHIPDPKRLPTELMTKGIIRNTKPYVEFDINLKFQYIAEKEQQEKYYIEEVDLVSDDDSPRKVKKEDKDNSGNVSGEDKPLDDLEDEEEELDEELDVGTDYMANYFDNGEDYLDDEEDSMDDSAVY